jgi:hypothetical protein
VKAQFSYEKTIEHESGILSCHVVQHTLFHWKISPSSNSTVKMPTGSTWIDCPQNLDLRLLSPQNFHPLPSQWQAMSIG